MEPSSLDNHRPSQEHDLETRTRVLEVKVSLQGQKMEDGFILLRTEMVDGFALTRTQMVDGFALVRAEMAKGFAEEARARAELEMRLNAKIQETAQCLETKFDALFRLLLKLQVTTIVLILGLAAKMMWPQ